MDPEDVDGSAQDDAGGGRGNHRARQRTRGTTDDPDRLSRKGNKAVSPRRAGGSRFRIHGPTLPASPASCGVVSGRTRSPRDHLYHKEEHVRQRSLLTAGRAASGRSPSAHGVRQPQRRRGQWQRRRWRQGRQDRRHRPPVRRPVGAGPRHPQLCRPRHPAGQRGRRPSRAGRSSSPPRTTRPSPTSARQRPPSWPPTPRSSVWSALSTPAWPCRCSPSSTPPRSPHGLAGEHQPIADPGEDSATPRRAPTRTTSAPHHRRDPGCVRGRLPLHHRGHQERRHHPRQEDLRAGPGGRLHRGSSRSWAARSSRPRRSTPATRTSPPSSPRSSR